MVQEFKRRFFIYSSLVTGSGLLGGALAFMSTRDQVTEYV
jgi:hypothetical protein